MIAVLDTSVLLRKLLGEPHPLAEWPHIRRAYASRILVVEIGRIIDRLRLEGRLNDEEVETLQQEARRLLRSVAILALDEIVLARAAGAMPTVLGTLDALHLATALELGRKLRRPFILATHDATLARAARASGLDVRGA